MGGVFFLFFFCAVSKNLVFTLVTSVVDSTYTRYILSSGKIYSAFIGKPTIHNTFQAKNYNHNFTTVTQKEEKIGMNNQFTTI